MTHTYCRTCGSKVLVKSVCHNCGCPPWKGHEFCNNCGAATKTLAIMCVSCGAPFKNNTKTLLTVLIAIALVITLCWAAYFIYYEGRKSKKDSPANNVKRDTSRKAVAK